MNGLPLIVDGNLYHVCQLADNTEHMAIGTDLGWAFGTEQGPLI